MDCRRFRDDLEGYLDGGLDFARRFAVERHAEQCYVCRAETDQAERLSQLTHTLHRTEAPANFEAALLQRIHAPENEHLLRRLWNSWLYRWDEISWRPLAVATVGGVCVMLAGISIGLVAQRVPPAADDLQTRHLPAPVPEELQ